MRRGQIHDAGKHEGQHEGKTQSRAGVAKRLYDPARVGKMSVEEGSGKDTNQAV